MGDNLRSGLPQRFIRPGVLRMPVGVEQRLDRLPAGLFRDQFQKLGGVLLRAAVDQQNAVRADDGERIRSRSCDLDEVVGKLGGGKRRGLRPAQGCTCGPRECAEKMTAMNIREHRQSVYYY